MAKAAAAPPIDSPPGAPGDGEARELNRALKASLIAHGGLLVFFVLKSLVFPGTGATYTPSLRVDLVDLPDVLKKDLAKQKLPTSEEVAKALEKVDKQAKEETKTKKSKAPPAEEASPDEMVLKPKEKAAQDSKKREKKMKSALDRIKALNKITEEDAPKAQPVKGNMISKGTSLSGDAKESLEANYFDLLRDRIAEYWELNPLLARQNLSAQVRVHIDGMGRLVKVSFVRISGNAKFDDEVKRAIQRSAPFPKPPVEIADGLLTEGVGLGFPL